MNNFYSPCAARLPKPMEWALLCCLLVLPALATQAANPILTPGSGMAQAANAELTVSGRVTDAATNEALAGCTVVLKGSPKSPQKTLNDLKANKAGFFVMAEGAQIDYGGHANDMRYVVQEMLDFDQAIGEALRFADSNRETLVIITADHETGGLSLLDGDLKRGYVDGNFSTNDHSGIMVPIFAYGPHSLDFRGVYENTEIQRKIMAILQHYQSSNQLITHE